MVRIVKGNFERVVSDYDFKSFYKTRGWVKVEDAEKVDETENENIDDPQEAERLALLEQAKELGLKPSHNTGIAKLQAMIEEALGNGKVD